MPIFAIIQVIASRVIIAIVAIITAFGLGSVSDSTSTTKTVIQENHSPKTEKIITPNENIPIPEPNKDIPYKTKDKTENTIVSEKPLKENASQLSKQSENIIPPLDSTITKAKSSPSFSQINTETSKALVNVFCSQKVVGAANPITGSGVIIDPRGVIITNAHVAQFFLLRNYPIKNSLECILRVGSPARAMYTAELLYISPEWISLHAKDITNPEPKGTGEDDYAFLRITGRTDPNANLPDTFPFISINTNGHDIKTGNQVLAAAYPAGFLGSISIQRDLYSVSSVTTVGERFTFIKDTIDLFSIGGTVVSQGGSSGGAVVSNENKLIGIIVTSTNADTTAERDMRAITLGYINRAITKNANTTIDGLLLGNITLKSKLFNLSVAPTLTNLLLEKLIK